MEKNNKNSKPEYHLSSVQQHEDAVLKTSMQFFADELLPYLNVKGKVVSFAPTELVHLELQKLFQYFNFIMEDGTWKHFEFQSTNEGLKGLKRFRAYEAFTSYQYNVVVKTYVLFSGNIKKPMTEFSEGINTYCIHPIIMQSKNADELLKSLEEKQNRGELITKEDLIPLVLCPLMNGKTSQKERINRAYHITRKATEIKKEDTDKIEAMLYAMADKFLDAVDLEKLKEEIAMTRLGQMIWEDARNETFKKMIQIKLEKGKTIEEIAEDLEQSQETIKELAKML
ncbi:MAG: hypothetical protein IKY94_08810 [Lachnospiraceae bacterium]|nr:hypothetical protein [Lachnospiraceae bacterium]